jgi:hypothetical protein
MSLSNKVDQFNGASDLVHRFVHADKNTDIQTQGGPVPSIAKLADVLQKRVIEVVELQRVLQQMLAANSGAGLVKTSDGKTVQAALDGKANASGNATQDFTGKRLTAYNPGNSVYLEGGANGIAPALVMTGAADANVGLYFGAKGTGEYNFTAAGGRCQFRIVANPNAVNYILVYGGNDGANPVFGAQGVSTNIGLDFRVKGTGEHIFRGHADAYQFAITNTINAVNFPLVRASITGQGVTFGAEGTDANTNVNVRSKGMGNVTLMSANAAAFYAQGVANAVNVLAVFNGIAGQSPRFEAVGGDANINLRLAPKGSGNVTIDTGLVVPTITLSQPAPSIHFFEQDQAGAVGVWRMVADGGSIRLDMSTHAGRGFATYKTPWTVNANGVLTVPTPSNEPLAVVNAEYVNSALASSPGGAMVLLGSATVNPATPVANIDFLNICTAAYDHYVIDINDASNTVVTNLCMQMAVGGVVDNGSNIYTQGANADTAGNNGSQMALTNETVTLGSSSGRANFTLDVRNTNAVNGLKPVSIRGISNRSTGSNVPYVTIREAMYRGTSAVSGFRFFWFTGNFAGGTIRIYGIKNA